MYGVEQRGFETFMLMLGTGGQKSYARRVGSERREAWEDLRDPLKLSAYVSRPIDTRKMLVDDDCRTQLL